MSGKIANKIITNGLVLYVDAANKASYSGYNNTWNDISKNGTIGTLVQNPTFNSANGGYLTFNGTNQSVNGVDSKGLLNVGASGSVTIEAFVSPTVINSYFFSYGYNTGGAFVSYAIGISSTFTTAIQTGVTSTYGGSIPSNQWTSVTVSLGTGGYRYINGSPISSVSDLTATPADTNGYWSIGALNSSNSNLFTGRIACVRVYNRVLSAAEVLQNYNATKDRFGL
jgi:hypothetical protein